MRSHPAPFVAALAQYPIEAVASWAAYAEKITRWVGDAAREGAKLAVFPEYGAMELASLDPATMGDLAGNIVDLEIVDTLGATLAGKDVGPGRLNTATKRRD